MRHFTVALPVLQFPIISVDTSLLDLIYLDNLKYHYIGGIALEAEDFRDLYWKPGGDAISCTAGGVERCVLRRL
jgi:hypothetical protein